MTGLSVRGLSVTFAGQPEVEALRSVDLHVPDRSLTAVLGPSGCGKTTLLRVIAGLQRPGAGRITMHDSLFDDEHHHVAPERRNIGLVPQDGALFPHLDVARNIAFGIRRLAAADRRRRVDEMLAMVDLDGHGSRQPSELSGGQQQRVALARALAPDPSLVLLDEPFSALDSGLRAEVRAQVTSLLRRAATTAVIVTHDQTEALEMADQVVVMRQGRVVQADTPTTVYRRPVDVWTGRFIGEAIVLPALVRDGVADCALGVLPLVDTVDDGPAEVFLRPEQVHRSTDRASAKGTVRSVRFRGADAAVEVELEGTVIVIRSAAGDIPDVGDDIGVKVSGPAIAFEHSHPAR